MFSCTFSISIAFVLLQHVHYSFGYNQCRCLVGFFDETLSLVDQSKVMEIRPRHSRALLIVSLTLIIYPSHAQNSRHLLTTIPHLGTNVFVITVSTMHFPLTGPHFPLQDKLSHPKPTTHQATRSHQRHTAQFESTKCPRKGNMMPPLMWSG